MNRLRVRDRNISVSFWHCGLTSEPQRESVWAGAEGSLSGFSSSRLQVCRGHVVPGGWLAALLALGRQPLGGGTNLARVEQKSAVADLTRSAPTLRNPRVTSVLVGVTEGACHGDGCCARESDRPVLTLAEGWRSQFIGMQSRVKGCRPVTCPETPGRCLTHESTPGVRGGRQRSADRHLPRHSQPLGVRAPSDALRSP